MDEYSQEINEIQSQIDAMVEAEEDANLIADLEMQLQILRTLYQQATMLLAEGEGNPELRRNLAMRGYGDWTLDNVYAFVYERSVELESKAHSAFVGGIKTTDFALLLNS